MNRLKKRIEEETDRQVAQYDEREFSSIATKILVVLASLGWTLYLIELVINWWGQG